MFEKESNGMTEEERTDFVIALKRKMCLENGKVTDADVYFQGVKAGYNKANEWHYARNGDVPKDEGWKWCLYKSGYPYVAKYEILFNRWTNQDYKEVTYPYVWKEIELPKCLDEN